MVMGTTTRQLGGWGIWSFGRSGSVPVGYGEGGQAGERRRKWTRGARWSGSMKEKPSTQTEMMRSFLLEGTRGLAVQHKEQRLLS